MAETAATAFASMGAGVAFDKITSGAKNAVDAFSRLKAAQSGVNTVAERMGQSISGVNQIIQDLTRDGLMNLADASTGVKNLLASGFNLEQTTNLMMGFRDAAAFGRQSSLGFGEAIRSATEGVKNGNSILVDNAGITKNLSVILQEAGYSAQDLQKATTDVNVRMALYNGILKESNLFQGDAAKLAGELAGQQAKQAAEAEKLKAIMGGALAPAFSVVSKESEKWLHALRLWIEVNPEVARGLTITAASLTGAAIAAGTAATAVRVLAMALPALAAAAGPITLLVAGAAALAAALVGVALAAKANSVAQTEQEQQITRLGREYGRLNDVMKGGSEAQKKKAQEELKRVIAEVGDLMPELVARWDSEGRAIELNTQKLQENTKAAQDNLRVKAQKDLEGSFKSETEAKNVLKNLENEIEAERDLARRPHQLNLSAGVITQEQYDKVVGQDINAIESHYAASLAIARRNVARAAAETNRLLITQSQGRGMDDFLDATVAANKSAATAAGSGGGGGKEMSPALKAALEDLQDLQALDKSPDNLRKTLERVREILRTHGTELKKLEKDRDLIRLADITLPKELTQAEFGDATRRLQTEEQLAQAKGKPLDPAVIKARLQAIKDQFASYLEQNKDAGASIDVRLAGLDPEEIRQKVQWALDAIEGKKKLMGKGYSPEQERSDLAAVIPIAYVLPGKESTKEVDDLLDRVRKLDEGIQAARFEEKIKGIGKAFEDAQVQVAPVLADLEKKLITEEAKGDKADPKRVKALKEQMLGAVKPAMEAQRDALQALLQDDKLTKDQRAEVQRDLNQVVQTLYAKDVDAHRLASEAKVAQERKAADIREKLQTKVMKALEKAEKAAMEALKASNKTAEDALEKRIKDKERELTLYERQIAAEDRLKKITEARKAIADLERTGEREQVLLANGTFEMRIRGMDEAQAKLAEAEKDDREARAKEALQDEITALRGQLDNLRDSNREKEQALTKHFTTAKEILTDGFDKMKTAQTEGIGAMVDGLKTDLAKLLDPWKTYTSDVQKLLDSIKAPAPTGGISGQGATGTAAKTATTANGAGQAAAASPAVAAPDNLSKLDEVKALVRNGKRDEAAKLLSDTFGMSLEQATINLRSLPKLGEGAYLPGGNPFPAIVNDSEETMLPHKYLGGVAARIAELITPRMQALTMPTMPTMSPMGGGGASFGPVSISVQVSGAAAQTPEGIGQAVASGVEQGMESAFRRNWALGIVRK